MKKLILILLVFSFSASAQKFENISSIGNFAAASSFYITANGYIYVCDEGKDELIMLDTLGNQYKTFGGYGWSDDSFDDPADVFADPLTIYIADKNNHSIKRLDKNLNFLSSFTKKESNISEEQFGYPSSVATSNQGDLYLIDGENKRVIKFDIFGNFIQNFGGIDAGNYQLSDPSQLAISSANNIYVIDNRQIVVFDNFGSGIARLEFDNRLKSIRILFDALIVTDISNNVFYSNLRSIDGKIQRLEIDNNFEKQKIVSALVLNGKLYLLSEKNILVFANIN
jgi:hypothetical protein